MQERHLRIIYLFLASEAETKPIRDKIVLEMKSLSSQHEKSGYVFQLLRWEDVSSAYSLSGRSEDEYLKLIDQSHMFAVIIQNTVGKYMIEEFEYAEKKFRETGTFPKVVVYTLPTNKDNGIRQKFIKQLREGKKDYFHSKVDDEDALLGNIVGELLRIKDQYEASIQEVEATIERVNFDSSLTQEAIELFQEGKYDEAIKTLDMDLIRERDK